MCQGQDSWTQFYPPNIRYTFLLCITRPPAKIFQTSSGKSQSAGTTSNLGRVSPEAEGVEHAGSTWLPAGRKAVICLTALGILYTEIHATRDVVQVESVVHEPLETAQEYERVCNIRSRYRPDADNIGVCYRRSSGVPTGPPQKARRGVDAEAADGRRKPLGQRAPLCRVSGGRHHLLLRGRFPGR